MDKIIYGIEKGVFIVDEEDYEWLNQYQWRDHPDGYAQCRIDGKNTSMHRLIMNDPQGYMIDHINRLVNDNRRLNLRLSNASLNQANKRKSKNKSTNYKGVVKRSTGSYEVTIKKDGVYMYLGTFSDVKCAANCYNFHALKLYGEHAHINDIEIISEEEWLRDKSKQEKLSKYRGVHKSRKDGLWRVRVFHNGKEHNFGLYSDEEAAANCYNINAKKLVGEKAIINDVPYMSQENVMKYKVEKRPNSSGYNGVTKRGENRYLARIYHDKEQHEIGYFDTVEKAAIAWNEYVVHNELNRKLNNIV